MDGKCLSFKAFLKEDMPEAPEEGYRVRRFNIFYFLVDHTARPRRPPPTPAPQRRGAADTGGGMQMRISEDRQENSGLPQGGFLKRSRVPLLSPGSSVGVGAAGDAAPRAPRGESARAEARGGACRADVERDRDAVRDLGPDPPRRAARRLRPPPHGAAPPNHSLSPPRPAPRAARARLTAARAGRQIVDCDQYTRQFFADKGQPQPEGNLLHMIPKDPYFQRRKAAEEKISLKVPDDRRERFINFNRKVLRFYCQWDDRAAIYGERRPYILHLYLEDDTVEICEVKLPNDGRDGFSKLLRRQKLPKDNQGLQDIGAPPLPSLPSLPSRPSLALALQPARALGKAGVVSMREPHLVQGAIRRSSTRMRTSAWASASRSSGGRS
jgi:hypothetical protein